MPRPSDAPGQRIVGSVLFSIFIIYAYGYIVLLTKPKKPLPGVTEKGDYPSPKKTLLSKLSVEDQAKLSYPPNLIPGARDVSTALGTMRVYEWGPETGRKVLLVHGDATPSPVMYPLAEGLVQAGCRVMLFDLWGRGYSSTPDPTKHPHNVDLFVNQVLLAITSSPLSWTGSGSSTESGGDKVQGFALIGFSLGGGIAVNFASSFPNLVNSLVLLGPSGLMRKITGHYRDPLLRNAKGEQVHSPGVRLKVGRAFGVDVKGSDDGELRFDWITFYLYAPRRVIEPAVELSPAYVEAIKKSEHRAQITRENIDTRAILREQFINHYGFVPAFVSTVQHAPLQGQEDAYRRVLRIISGWSDNSDDDLVQESPLHGSGRLLVVSGEKDDVIPEKETLEDIRALLPLHENGTRDGKVVVSRKVPGGHEFPVPRWKEVCNHITDFWGMASD